MNTTESSKSVQTNSTEKNRLLSRLRSLATNYDSDKEYGHRNADRALLDYINDPEVTQAFEDIEKWYC